MIKVSGTIFSSYVLALGLFAVSGSLVYFAMTLAKVADALPAIVDEIQEVEDGLDPLIEEVGEVRALVPGIVDEVANIRETIPPLIAEIEKTRQQIPAILDEAKSYRETIPAILAETEALRSQVPAVLGEVAAIRKEIPPIVDEVGRIRETIPDILTEMEEMRVAIPGYLETAQGIADNIDEASQKAGEGAVQGVFTGLIKAPVNIVASIGGNALNSPQLTDEDKSILWNTAGNLVQSGEQGDSVEWKNPETGIRGIITIVSIDDTGPQMRVTLEIRNFRRLKKVGEGVIVVRRKEDGSWELVGEQEDPIRR